MNKILRSYAAKKVTQALPFLFFEDAAVSAKSGQINGISKPIGPYETTNFK